MIKDFTPARASLASGIVIKQTLLERNKYPQPEVTWERYDYSGSIPMANITGSTGGTFNQYNGLTNDWEVTQSWIENIVTPYGLQPTTRSSQDEFYNGEFSGSVLTVENGELNEANPVKQVETTPLLYSTTGSNSLTNAAQGQIFWSAGIHSAPPSQLSLAQGIQYLYINETDANGVNILTALQNLNSGDSITFTIDYTGGNQPS
jgi:hypothetical protein